MADEGRTPGTETPGQTQAQPQANSPRVRMIKVFIKISNPFEGSAPPHREPTGQSNPRHGEAQFSMVRNRAATERGRPPGRGPAGPVP